MALCFVTAMREMLTDDHHINPARAHVVWIDPERCYECLWAEIAFYAGFDHGGHQGYPPCLWKG
jgi:hypothetical protein